MTVRWLTTFLDRPAPIVRRTPSPFWTAVTGSTLSAARGEHGEFATLIPADGDAYLRMQRVAAGPGGSHLDLHTDDIAALADGGRTPRRHASSSGWTTSSCCGRRPACCSAPCTTAARRSARRRCRRRRPRTQVDQVCIDVPPDEYERECAFWAALTGWEHRPAMLPEYSYLDRPEPIATRVLFQRLGDGRRSARAPRHRAATTSRRAPPTTNARARPSRRATRGGRRCTTRPGSRTASIRRDARDVTPPAVRPAPSRPDRTTDRRRRRRCRPSAAGSSWRGSTRSSPGG